MKRIWCHIKTVVGSVDGGMSGGPVAHNETEVAHLALEYPLEHVLVLTSIHIVNAIIR